MNSAINLNFTRHQTSLSDMNILKHFAAFKGYKYKIFVK